ncbi:MAG: DoxX family protein [Actinobacteria bacterium]|nr:DoxX family protein [Actinomycetota bacterium]
MRHTIDIEEPAAARALFGSTTFAPLWLVLRLWLGWEWFQAGWSKVFGGTITWRFWDWGKAAYSFGGTGNIGWVRSGTVLGADGTEQVRHVGDAVAGFAAGAVNASSGPHPDVAYSWYVEFLKWVQHTAAPVVGPMVAVGELLIGLALLVGMFTGIVAALGALLNFSYVFAGSAGVNPAMILVSMGLILAWRNAGWIGLDRWLLPAIGVPWRRRGHGTTGGSVRVDERTGGTDVTTA